MEIKGKVHCSEERSLISPDYARNFICDFIIGKEQEHSERSLFDDSYFTTQKHTEKAYHR